VTRLPAKAVGAIDIFEAETHVDIAEEFVELVLAKLNGIPDARRPPEAVPDSGSGQVRQALRWCWTPPGLVQQESCAGCASHLRVRLNPCIPLNQPD